MDDKFIMENILNIVKGMSTLYHQGTSESGTEQVHTLFKELMDNAVCHQNTIYSAMMKNGWYQVGVAETKQIQSVLDKFANK